MNKKQRKPVSYLQYAGMASQWIILLLVAVYLGRWMDTRVQVKQPLFIWLLPLLGLAGLLIKLIRDTSKK